MWQGPHWSQHLCLQRAVPILDFLSDQLVPKGLVLLAVSTGTMTGDWEITVSPLDFYICPLRWVLSKEAGAVVVPHWLLGTPASTQWEPDPACLVT